MEQLYLKYKIVMEETRVKKYQNYRNSLSKRDGEVYASYTKHKISKTNVDDVLNEQKVETPSISTISISYQHIFDATKDKEEKSLIEIQRRRKHILKIVLISLGCALLLALIIVAAVLIF